MLEVILRDPNSEAAAISSHLGFSTLSIKCLFVCGWQEVKRGTGCQVSECCNEGLGQSQGLFMFWQIWDWLTQLQETANTFWFLFFVLAFCMSSFSASSCFFLSSFIVCLSLIFSVSHSLLQAIFPFFFSHSLNFPCVYFSHCPLCLSLIVPLSFPHFFVSHAGCFLLPAAPCLSPLLPRVTDVLPTQKAPLLGLTPARLAPLFWWTPGGFRFKSDRIPFLEKALGLPWQL